MIYSTNAAARARTTVASSLALSKMMADRGRAWVVPMDVGPPARARAWQTASARAGDGSHTSAQRVRHERRGGARRRGGGAHISEIELVAGRNRLRCSLALRAHAGCRIHLIKASGGMRTAAYARDQACGSCGCGAGSRNRPACMYSVVGIGRSEV
jgi:hypothetical protein